MNALKSVIARSAIWSAYGDALGFMTELASLQILKSREVSLPLRTTHAWKRRIGGRFGLVLDLPEGCYSDDSQLRLATCRAIGPGGKFDVEAFAKVELAVWPAYALGAGIGSRAAAANLARSDINWFSNFYRTKRTEYLSSGGNGAAMRIQPHVWASSDLEEPGSYLPEVIRNAITTHGHPLGILGAVFHARCLAHVLRHGSHSTLRDWSQFARDFRRVPEYIMADRELAQFWLPVWEQQARSKFSDAISKYSSEVEEDLNSAGLLLSKSSSASTFEDFAEALRLRDPRRRGTGTTTALMASVVALRGKEQPGVALAEASSCLGTDTDTISSMAGALLGVTSKSEPPGQVMDADYVIEEALRMEAIANGQEVVDRFAYPDLQKWSVPQAQADVIARRGKNGVVVLGLGPAKLEKRLAEDKDDFVWNWYGLSFGQNILVRTRKEVRVVEDEAEVGTGYLRFRRWHPESNDVQPSLFYAKLDPREESIRSGSESSAVRRRESIDAMTDDVIKARFDERMIGHNMMKILKRERDVDKVVAYAAIIAKAWVSRADKK